VTCPRSSSAATAAMKTVLYTLANIFAGLVLVLLLIDPNRPLKPIFVLLALALVYPAMEAFLRKRWSPSSEWQKSGEWLPQPGTITVGEQLGL
jgi:hypothetical protein